MKLTYFNVRGLAETTRMILAVNNQNGDREEYEDFRYPLEIVDMSKHQMNKPEFDADKENNLLLQSLNKVPFLTVDDVVIPQSKSIERFLARRFGLMGTTELENARIDSICECVVDFKNMYQKVRVAENKDKAMNEWFTVTLIEKLSLLENLLGIEQCNSNSDHTTHNSTCCCEYSVGSRLSLSDIVLYSFITNFFDNKEASMNATLATPKLRNIVTKVGELPEIQKWLEERPQTDF